MGLTTIRFDVISKKRKLLLVCANCGRTFQRTIKVEQTHNPFNKNAAGKIKLIGEIQLELMDELERECAAAKRAPRCTRCQSEVHF